MKPRLLVVCNDQDFFLLHRLPETTGALQAGYEVHVATPRGTRDEEIKKHGFIPHVLPLTRSGRNPLQELRAFLAIRCLFLKVSPDLVYLMTIKPILYGGIAARLSGVKSVVSAVFGLGFVFTDNSWRTRILRCTVVLGYRLALSHPRMKVVFQNPEDRRLLINVGAVDASKTVMIQGSGVDLNLFSATAEPKGVPVVLMAARLLRDKGVREYAEAARILKETGYSVRMLLAGDLDKGNPASLDSAELDSWRDEGNLELLGYRSDIPTLLSEANVVVLPSYREGLPRILEEAAAASRAIITTDVPGCRDAIVPDKTGLLVPVRDSVALAAAIKTLLNDDSLRRAMSHAGRRLAEDRYDVENIVKSHLALYKELLEAEDFAK